MEITPDPSKAFSIPVPTFKINLIPRFSNSSMFTAASCEPRNRNPVISHTSGSGAASIGMKLLWDVFDIISSRVISPSALKDSVYVFPSAVRTQVFVGFNLTEVKRLAEIGEGFLSIFQLE